MKVGREAGFIPDRVTLLTDTTRTKGAGAVMDTYTLLRKGIRKLLKQLGYAAAGKQRGLSPETQRLMATYVEQDRKAKIDWTDPQQRAAQLQVLFQDAEAALDLATEQMDDADVRATGWLLVKILGDDIEPDDQGQPQIAEGTAPDRIISITEPEMRHGRKSSAVRFDGFKAAVTTEQSSELILDIQDIRAAGSDGQELMPTIERVEQHAGVTVERIIGDGAYGSGENRAACATHQSQPVDLVAPLARPNDPEVDKSAFAIDLAAQTATCPQGHTVTGQAGSPKLGCPPCASPSRGRLVKPARCSSAASRARRPAAPCRRILTMRICKRPASASRPTNSKTPIGCARLSSASRPNWSTRLARHALPGPPEAPTPAPLASGHRQLEAPVPALRVAQADLNALLAHLGPTPLSVRTA